MHRRTVLRLGGTALAATGVAGRAAGHDPPGGGTDEDVAHTPPSTPTGDDSTPTVVSDGYSPLGRADVEGATEAVVADDGQTAFVAATSGYAVVDISTPESPTVVADRRDIKGDHEDGPLGGIFDVKHDGDTLLVVGPANGRAGEYLSGMLVVDVSDPANPAETAFYETDYPIHNCYLDGETAYLTANHSEGIRLEIVDVGGELPTKLGDWSLTDEDERWADVAGRLRVVHDVFVQDGVAYLAHWDAGTWLLDVSDPTAPSVVSSVAEQSLDDLIRRSEDGAGSAGLTLPGNSHYVAVDEAGELMAVGREAWATTEGGDGGPGGIDLYDVSDPTAPAHLSHIEPPETPDATVRGYWTTAHNFELRGGVLYSSWYRGGVKRHDVSDPEAPEQLTWWADPFEAEFWTAQAAVPGETFVAASRGVKNSNAGLFVFPDTEGKTVRPFERQASSPATETAEPSTAAPATDTASTATNGPGFGVLGALVGIGGLAWRRATQRSE